MCVAAMKAKTHYQNGNGNGNGGAIDESGGSNSPSPPPSPRRRSSLSFCRRRLRSKPYLNLAGGVIFRWNLRYLFVLSLLYVSGLIMCVGPFSALVGLGQPPPPPGSLYRSDEMFRRLWNHIQYDNSSGLQVWLMGFSYIYIYIYFIIYIVLLNNVDIEAKKEEKNHFTKAYLFWGLTGS